MMVDGNGRTDHGDKAREALDRVEATLAPTAETRRHLPVRVHRLLVRAAVLEILARSA